MPRIEISDFDLQKTIESGQIFRWMFLNGWYFIGYRNSIIKIKQTDSGLEYESKGITKKQVEEFLRLDDDYKSIIKQISKDAYVKKAIANNKGLRLLRQDPWECLVSFVCSSASNIPKIQKNLQLISKQSGNYLEFDGNRHATFPDVGELGSENELRDAKTGFRARYLAEISNIVTPNYFKKLSELSYDDAKVELMKLPGVGEKVADCICLFSLDKMEAFPVDVWIKRAMEDGYFEGRKSNHKKIAQFARSYFGKNAGYAQQFLYHQRRTQG